MSEFLLQISYGTEITRESHEDEEILLSERKVINKMFSLALELLIPAVLYEEYLTIGHYLRL